MHKIPQLKNKITSLANLRTYCRSVFHELLQSLKIKRKVWLLSIIIPFSSLNGFTISLGRKSKSADIIFVNLWPYWHSRKESPTMQFFYLFSVVAHELKHIKILQDWYSGSTIEFGILFSEWALEHTREGWLAEWLARRYLSFKGASALRRKRYDVSPIELLCYQYGFKEAFNRYSHALNENELKIAETILASVEFINRHIEIDYFSSKQAYNRFTHTLHYLNRSARKHPDKVAKYPQLSHIFTPHGLLKTPSQLFMERSEDNAELIDYILVRMFITVSFDWNTIFNNDQALYSHICKLSNDYCTEAINYLKNSSIGEVFLSQSVLQDNAAMLIKNVNTLNHLMDNHQMIRTSGSLLPLYYSDDFTKGVQNIEISKSTNPKKKQLSN